jgi:hypothetical protein
VLTRAFGTRAAGRSLYWLIRGQVVESPQGFCKTLRQLHESRYHAKGITSVSVDAMITHCVNCGVGRG